MLPTDYFTPENSALLLIDHQVGTMQLIKNLPLEQVRRHTLALARLARMLGMPVMLTSSQEERFQGLLMPELATLLPEEYAARVKRQGLANAWDDPAFVDAVAATGRRNLLMAGVTTDVCVVFKPQRVPDYERNLQSAHRICVGSEIPRQQDRPTRRVRHSGGSAATAGPQSTGL